jgi:hypothetical protein
MVVDQGSSFTRVVTWRDESSTPVNITGYTARMKVKRAYSSTSTLLSLTLSSGLSLGGTAGTITITITAGQTAALPVQVDGAIRDPLVAVYDLELVSGSGQVTRLLEGNFIITPEVTTA